MRTLEELARAEEPWVVAHRGYSARHPENTLSAFEAAIDAGADLIELDVGLSVDRVPMVLHDDTLERTTDGRGRLAAHTAAQLAALDAGSWFGRGHAGERIPTLRAVLERIGPRIPLNLELKRSAFEEPAPQDALERQVRALAQELGLQGSVVVSSFEHAFCTRTGELSVGLLYDTLPPDAAARCRERSALFCAPHAAHVTRAGLERLAQAGIRTVPYTVDDEQTMRRLLEWGAGGLFTNDPARLRRVLEERRP